MKQRIADYTVIIEKDRRTGSGESCYTAYVPTLGIATDADTRQKVQQSIQELVEFHLETLIEEGEKVPIERVRPIITRLRTRIPAHASFASA